MNTASSPRASFGLIRPGLVSSLAAAMLLLIAASANAGPIIPIDASDTIHGTGDDFSTGALNLGFTFPYFGGSHTQVFINSNGNLTFGGGNTNFSNGAFPAGAPPMIAPFWDDLIIGPGQLRSNALTAGVFTAIWNGPGFFGAAGSIVAEAILFGAGNPYGYVDGSIIFSYGTVTNASTFWNPAGATVGLSAGNNADAATLFPLGIGNAGGLVGNPAAASLSDRSFLFTPTRGGYSVTEIDSLGTPVVPEPASAVLLGIGAGAGWYVRRRANRKKIA